MSAFLFENFLENPKEYDALRLFWVNELNSLVPRGEQYERYAAEEFQNGVPFRDGNPIFSAINWRANKAVRIVQESPQDFGEYYSTFENAIRLRRPNFPIGRILVKEKVIVLTLTDSTLRRCLIEVQRWLFSN